MKRKILAINSYNHGSTGKVMIGIAETAAEKGYYVYTACPNSKSMKQNVRLNQFLIGSQFSRNLHILLSEWTGMNGCFSVLSTFFFLRKLDKISPELIHLHNLHNCYINIPMLFGYLKRKHIPVVWTLHDCWAFTGQCPHFTMAKCEKWKHGCNNCPTFQEYPESRVDMTKNMWKLKKRWFTGVENLTIVTPSQWLADLVKQSFLKEYQVEVIHNGIDLNVFKPTESDFRKKYNCEGKFILLGVAFGWGIKKGLDVFIELAKLLDDRFQIVIVGSNEFLDKQLPNNIVSIHRTSNLKELAEFYTASDLFVNPTREEVLGLVNIEALACGTPVITFQTGGCPEILTQECGVVVKGYDVNVMYEEILRIYEHNPYSKEECQKRAKVFESKTKYAEYVALYSRKLGGSEYGKP